MKIVVKIVKNESKKLKNRDYHPGVNPQDPRLREIVMKDFVLFFVFFSCFLAFVDCDTLPNA